MENPIKIDDLGVPLFLETPIYPLKVQRFSCVNVFSVKIIVLVRVYNQQLVRVYHQQFQGTILLMVGLTSRVYIYIYIKHINFWKKKMPVLL